MRSDALTQGRAVGDTPPPPSTPSPPSPPSRAADALSVAAVLFAVASHLRFVLVDTRLPRDLGFYFADLPRLYEALGAPASALSAGARALVEPGGGYQLALAVYLRVVGRGGTAFQLVDVAWLLVLVGGVALVARRRAGPAAGAAAACLVGAFPAVVVGARTAWIHVPEAALLVVVLWAWLDDPGWRRRGPWLAAALAGACALALRQSAITWIGLLAVAMGWGLWREPSLRRWGRWAGLAGIWLVGAIPVARTLLDYLQTKAAARPRDALLIPGLVDQAIDQLGPAPLALTAAGLVAALWPASPRLRRARGDGVLLAWAGTPIALYLLFRAGLDNFTIGLAALAVLAGAGLARRPRIGLPAAALVLAAMLLPTWLPEVRPGGPGYGLLQAARVPAEGSFRHAYRAYTGDHPAEVLDVLDATCPDDPSVVCRIAVDQGLFQPYTEDPGELELFLAGRDEVRIARLADRDRDAELPHVHALSRYDCGALDADWRTRYPDSLANVEALLARQDLRLARSSDVDKLCRWQWYTHGGEWTSRSSGEELREGDPDRERATPAALPPPKPPPGRPPAERRPRPRQRSSTEP